MLAILGKEFKAYFNSATGYVFMGVFLLICGIFFANYNLIPASPLYSNVLSSMTFVFLILVPIVTMKLIAEERHQKTDQLLLTSPISITQIVLGKYLASIVLFLITLLITILYPVILSIYGIIPVGEVVAAYIGFALMGSAFLSVGLFISSLTENQVVSAVASFGALLIIWILDWIQQSLPSSSKAGVVLIGVLVIISGIFIYFSIRSVLVAALEVIIAAAAVVVVYIKSTVLYEGLVPKLFGSLSLLKRFESFSMGIVDFASIIYFITFTAAFIFLTIQTIEKKRWN